MSIVDETILKINSFKNINELHDYISNELNLDLFTYDEFEKIWKEMNLKKYN